MPGWHLSQEKLGNRGITTQHTLVKNYPPLRSREKQSVQQGVLLNESNNTANASCPLNSS